jgi:glycosyltransferase involved in cell wall biosynthesis
MLPTSEITAQKQRSVTPLHVLRRKLRSAKFYVGQWYDERLAKRHTHQQLLFCRQWAHSIAKSGAEVLIGANFVPFGGTRQHMHSIRRFSNLNVQLIPGDDLLKSVTAAEFVELFSKSFDEWVCPSTICLHSHVFPWFIHWCSEQQKRRGLRWIHTHHNWYYPEFSKGDLLPWQKEFNNGFLFALKYADVSLCVSRWQQRFLKNTFGIDTFYLPNGVDVSACLCGNASRGRQWIQEESFVLYLGRNDPVKNPVDFVRLARALPQVQFVMLGQDLSIDCLQNEWSIECPSNLKVLGGVSHTDAQDAIAACSVLVMTSLREGLPTLALEGMAHGKPVVVPSEDGCMEAVGDGEFGFVYLQGDIDSLTAQVERALHDRRHCDAARERVYREFDWPQITRVLDQIYRRNFPC